MQIGVVYCEPGQQVWLKLELPETTRAGEAITASGLLERFPHLDLGTHKIGIFGRLVKPDAALQDGDRVEIYRPIFADPETVPRRDTGEE